MSGGRLRRTAALPGAAALLLASAAAPLGAQQEQQPSEADIFDTQAFDQSVAASQKEEQANKLEYLVGGVFLLDNSFQTAASFDGYTAAGTFSSKAFVRLTVPSYGALYLGYNLRHTLYQGDGGTLDSGPSPATVAELFDSFPRARRRDSGSSPAHPPGSKAPRRRWGRVRIWSRKS